MKKIKFILLFSVLCIMASCEDATNIIQPGQVDPSETFKDMAGLRKNIIGLYSSIPYENTIAFSSIFTDEVAIGVANGGQGLNDGTYSYVLNSNSDDAASIWYSNYSCINKCNRILEGIETVDYVREDVDTGDPGDQPEVNSIIAQARAIRAFCYLQLESYFSTDMTDPNALGVIVFTDVPEYNSNTLPRVKNSDVYALIDSDLAYATDHASDLDDNPPFDSAIATHVSSDFVTAVKARYSLFKGDYVNAEAYADQLIGSIPLTSAVNYPNMFNANEQGYKGEVIFKLERSINDGKIGNIWASVSANRTGSPFFEIGRALFNKFPLPNSSSAGTDVRKKVVANLTATSGSLVSSSYQSVPNYITADILCVGKYAGSEGVRLLNDAKVFRVSEMYFIKAECQIRAGNLTGAATTLRTLKQARRTSGTVALPVYADAMAGYKDLVAEKRLEFAFEGHRYLDIKRLGVLADVSFERDPKDCGVNNSCFFSNTDHRLTMPIPSAEFAANPNIVGQQNPGY